MKLWISFSLLLVLQPETCSAFVPHTPLHRHPSIKHLVSKRVRLSSSTKDGEEPPPEIQPLTTSFEDAGSAIIDEADEERLKSMGDFDSNSNYSQESIDNMRAAIQERAKSLGYEKSKVSQQYIEQAEQRARNQVANRAAGGSTNLDLSQISTGDEAKKSDWDESMPTMMYDPADELTDEEQAEADAVGQLPIWQQFIEEIKASQWPDLGTVIREIGVIGGVVAITALIIINWDAALRNIYTDLGMIPTPEEANKQVLDVDLIPEGFTNNMNEQDLARITEEMNKGGKSSSSPSVQNLLDSTSAAPASSLNPDL